MSKGESIIGNEGAAPADSHGSSPLKPYEKPELKPLGDLTKITEQAPIQALFPVDILIYDSGNA